MKGCRRDVEPHLFEPGDYGRWFDGWYARTPTGMLANLTRHDVTEHPDGTITASPSILVTQPGAEPESWHGYLERGVWRTC